MKTISFKSFRLATILLLLIALPLTANAYDFKVNGLCYSINSNGTDVTVTYEFYCAEGDSNPYAYENLEGNIAIPTSVTYDGNTFSVTAISEYAFMNCSGITNVTIPNSVTAIGTYAFSGCSGLTNVTIPNSISSIEDGTFNGCTGLTIVTIPNSVTAIGTYAFSGCSGLTNVTIPNSVTTIGDGAFSDCTNLALISLPNSITHIAAGIFFNCGNLTSITIPNSVTSIGPWAFKLCKSLTSITIPDPVTSIANEAFCDCSGLASITFPNTVFDIASSAFDNTAWYNNQADGLVYSGVMAYKYKGTMPEGTSITINQGTLGINDNCFYKCKALTSITIPNSVTSVGNYAFYGCSGLTSIAIPNSVTSIDNAAFYGCSGLTSVTIPNSVTSIGESAFEQCSSLTSVFIPNSVTSIGNYAFEYSGLTSVTIGNSVFYIGHSAFRCSGLKKIYSLIANPSSVSLGSNVFLDVNKNTCDLYVPMGKANDYRNTYQWNSFVNITEWTRVNSISISDSTLQLYAGKSETLQVSFEPADNSIQICDWTSSNPEVATVVQDGTVTAHAQGNATITATTIDGSELSATCEVTVTGAASLTLNKEEMSLFVGDSETLIPTIEPAEIATSNLHWQTNNPNVVTVNQNGLVTALAMGSATITVTTTDGTNLSASCLVNSTYEYALIADTIKHTRGEDAFTIEYPVELINSNIVSGLQFEVELPYGLSLMTDNDGYFDVRLDDARKSRNHTIDVTQLGNNYYKLMISSPTNNTLKGNDGTLFYMNLYVDQYHNSGIFNINFTNLTLTEADETEHTGLNTSSIVQYNYMLGDADADATVDVADHTTTLLHILNRPTLRFYADAANAHTANPAINVSDLVGIANIALGIRPAEILHTPALDGIAPASYNEPALDVNVRALEADKLLLTVNLVNNQPMAAMQLDLQLPEGLSVEDAELTGRAGNLQLSTGTLDDGYVRLLASAFSDAEIEPGNDAVLNIILKGNPNACGMVTFRNMIMAERNLNSYELETMTVPLNPTAIDGIIAGNEVRIYGENGCLVIDSPITGTAQLVLMNGIAKPLKVTKGRNEYRVDDNHIYVVNFNGTTAKLKF